MIKKRKEHFHTHDSWNSSKWLNQLGPNNHQLWLHLCCSVMYYVSICYALSFAIYWFNVLCWKKQLSHGFHIILFYFYACDVFIIISFSYWRLRESLLSDFCIFFFALIFLYLTYCCLQWCSWLFWFFFLFNQ